MTRLLLLLALLASGSARASTAGACRAAEREGRHADAAAVCRECMEDRFCAGRVAWLEARRDPDGGFRSLETVEAARRGAAAREDVRSVLTDPSAPLPVRGEAAAWLADAALREDEPEAALIATEPVWGEVDALPEAVRRRVVGLRAEALARLGRGEEAKAVEAPIRLSPPDMRTPVERILHAQRLDRLEAAAWAAGGLLVLAALPLGARGLRARGLPRPLGLLPLSVLIVGGALLADGWAEGTGAVLWALGAVLLPLHVLCALALAGLDGGRGTAAFRALAVTGTVAAGFVVLRRTGALGWVGW